MEKIVTIPSCCGTFSNLHMEPKFPSAELLEITLPEPFLWELHSYVRYHSMNNIKWILWSQ